MKWTQIKSKTHPKKDKLILFQLSYVTATDINLFYLNLAASQQQSEKMPIF
jgi:hypothetical protein